MQTFYNEWDKPTAAWLSELGKRGHLPNGHIDTRSIRDVRPNDLAGYEQCHFFAGIGGWPLALDIAGYRDLPCWTGSPPCQPFSIAGQQRGNDDERHLAPVWLDLIKACRPTYVFGEQVANAIRVGWIDDLFDALEGCGYACGAAVLPACSVGAPHIRKRLFFGAVRLAFSGSGRRPSQRQPESGPSENSGGAEEAVGATRLCEADRLADANQDGREPWREIRPIRSEHDVEYGGAKGRLANGDRSGPRHGGWEDVDWIGCRDGKFRPVESGTQPLSHGLPARVGRLRGYGNAIVPQAAAEFIKAFIESVGE